MRMQPVHIEKPWLVKRIDISIERKRFQVTGINLATGVWFSWTVPTVADGEYDLSVAVWTKEARMLYQMLGLRS